MTYLFKLAQRLAKFRIPFVLGVLGALGCTKGEKIEFLAPNPNQNTPVLNSIRVAPQVTSARVGSELQFTATGYTSAGAVIPATVDWSAAGGIITPDGRYTGVLTGSFVVKATARDRASVTDSARVGVWDNTTDLVTVVVSPDSAVLFVGDTLRFTAAMQMADGATTGTTNVTWSSTGGAVTPAGRFTATVPGVFQVTAVSANNLSGSAKVLVRQSGRTLTGIRLSPSAATINAGGSAQFVATADYDDGTTDAGDVEWRATGGTISNGFYTVTIGGGTHLVIATDRGGLVADTAIVTVPVPTLARLVISPAAPVLAPGAIQQFTAQAQMSDDSWQVVPLVWSASAGGIGPDGVYTAGAAEGVFRVIATSPGSSVADTAEVSIVAPSAELVKVNLNPSSATVPVGGTRQFTVSANWSNGGNSTPVVTWSATGGTITPSGLYTAGLIPGTYSVTATAENGRADTSSILITGALLTSLQLLPTSVSIQPAQSQQFTVAGTWSDGSTTAPSVTYAATGGTITAGGLYVSGSTAGTFSVIAPQQGGTLADTSLVTISTPTPTVTGVVLTPTSTVLAPGGIQQFSAVGLYSNGTTASISISWSQTGGSINSTGRYTAGATPGTYRVIARQSGNTRADTSAVTITSPPVVTSVTIAPKPLSLQINTTAQFSVSATWSDGSTTVPPISWTGTGGTVNSSGLYTAGATAGTFRVVATHQGGTKADTSVVTLTSAPVPPPTLIGLVVAPKPTSVPVNTTRQFNAGALWSDGSTTVPAITWSATGGTINSSGLFTAGDNAGTFRAIASGGGKADTSAVTVTSGSAATLTSLIIAPDLINLVPGETQYFSTAALWSDGGTTVPSITWSVTGGTITGGGIYTAGSTAGTFRVIAAGGGKADTATVLIGSGSSATVTSFVMTPASVTLAAGATQQFSTATTWSDGASHPYTVSYGATGGTVTGAGAFVAGSIAGSFAVIASCSCGAADTSSVLVTTGGPATLISLQLTPTFLTVIPGGTQPLTLSYTWSDGNTTAPSVSYSATGGGVSGGVYTAPAATGNYQIVVSHTGGTLKDTSFVTVANPAPPSVLYPNRPASFSRVDADFDFSQAVPGGTSGIERYLGTSGWSVIYDGNGGPSNFSVTSDPSAPQSPNSVWQLYFPAGVFGGGVEGVGPNGHGSGNFGRHVPSGDVYASYWIKWSSNWQWHQVSTKHLRFYPGVLIQALNNARWMRTEELNLGWGVDDPLGSNTYVNTPLSTGVWHHMEVLVMRGNPGTVKIWVDGQLRTSITSQPISPSTYTDFSIDGYLGGGGMTVLNDMYYWLDHVFIATP